MTWIDGAALGVVLLSAAFSMVRGFVRELLSVFAWIGALIAAFNLYPYVVPYWNSILPMKNLVPFLSMGTVFIVTLILLSLLAALISGTIRDSALSGVDRSLGLVFGAVRGLMLICIAYIALSVSLDPSQWPAPVVNARMLPVAHEGAVDLVSLLPNEYRPKVAPLPSATPPSAGSLMQQPVAGSALRTE
jgi:membrane protein required for colicin V production